MRSGADPSATVEPDITLVLDLDGVIEKATLSRAIGVENVDDWVGRRWTDLVDATAGDKIKRIVEDARTTGVSAFRQINQVFPSGLELPFEFTAVRLENQRSLVAIGKNLKAIAELQSRLIAAQQLMERDYWRLREAENRYRLLFDASNEPVLLIAAGSLQLVEANPSAIRAFDLPIGKRGRVSERPFMTLAAERDHAALLAMFERVRDLGRTPGIVVHLGEDHAPWIVRASLTGAESASEFILQCSRAGALAPDPVEETDVPLDALVERSPDGIAVVNRQGEIRRINRSFVELVGAPARGALIGEPCRVGSRSPAQTPARSCSTWRATATCACCRPSSPAAAASNGASKCRQQATSKAIPSSCVSSSATSNAGSRPVRPAAISPTPCASSPSGSARRHCGSSFRRQSMAWSVTTSAPR